MNAPFEIIQLAHNLVEQGREAEAVALVDRGVADGNPFAMFALADWRLRAVCGSRDVAEARSLFGRASEAGMPSARFFYTNFLAAGAGGEADWPEAMTRLKSEAALDPRRGAALRLIEKMDLDDRGHPRSLPPEQRLCEEMEVRLFAQLFTPEECTYVIAQAEPEFRRSTVADQLGGREYVDAARNSEGSTLHWFLADPAVHALNQRLASASHSSVKQGEHLHILRYGVGQEFRPHYDWSETVDNQRIKTALVYLNEDYEGGETLFVESGLKVKGRTGDAIVFRNATDEGDRDMKAMHAGLPVTSGTKLIASKWVRASRCAEYWG